MRDNLYRITFRDNHADDILMLAKSIVDVDGNLDSTQRHYLESVTLLHKKIQICSDDYYKGE